MPALGLLKSSDLSVLPWKSGPLGPRKPLKINLGFSPRRFRRPTEFFSKLFRRNSAIEIEKVTSPQPSP
jgi:hypothetical protein